MYLTLWTSLYVYRHFSRWLRTRGNPAGTRKVATCCNLTSRSHARPRQSPRRVAREPCGNPKSCNFTSRSVARPRQSMVRIARDAEKSEKKCNCTSRSVARPRQSMVKVARHAEMLEKMCRFTSRSRVRPRQSMGRVARHAEMLEKMCNFTTAFGRSTTPIPGKGCASRRNVGNYTSEDPKQQ